MPQLISVANAAPMDGLRQIGVLMAFSESDPLAYVSGKAFVEALGHLGGWGGRSAMRSDGLFSGAVGVYDDYVHFDTRGQNLDLEHPPYG
jgi:hypothetical protein